MANQNSKETSFFLWLIAPVGVALTLLFVNVNANVAAKRKTRDAELPAAEVKHEVSHSLSNRRFQSINNAGTKTTWHFNADETQFNISWEFQGKETIAGTFNLEKVGEGQYKGVGDKGRVYKFSFDGKVIIALGEEGAEKAEKIIFTETK